MFDENGEPIRFDQYIATRRRRLEKGAVVQLGASSITGTASWISGVVVQNAETGDTPSSGLPHARLADGRVVRITMTDHFLGGAPVSGTFKAVRNGTDGASSFVPPTTGVGNETDDGNDVDHPECGWHDIEALGRRAAALADYALDSKDGVGKVLAAGNENDFMSQGESKKCDPNDAAI